jgi:hypothetical protein
MAKPKEPVIMTTFKPERWTNYRTPSHYPLQGPPLEDRARLGWLDWACLAAGALALGIAAFILFA